MLRNPIPVPDALKNEPHIIQCSVLQNGSRSRNAVGDPDALYGKAMKLGKVRDRKYDHTKYPLETGMYDNLRKKYMVKKVFRPEEIPQDEKYHLHYLWRSKLVGETAFWVQRSWGIALGAMVKHAYSATDPEREYDMYISMKLTGPAYVKGSVKENAVYVDRVIFVKK